MAQYAKPLPTITDDNRTYWEYIQKHELRMQKCTQCGFIRFPVSILCPKCHAMDVDWVKLSGKGIIYSYVIYYIAYHPAYQNDIPYAVAIIQLEEGPRMESNISGCKMEDVKIDLPVEVIFEDVTDRVTLPKFKLVK